MVANLNGRILIVAGNPVMAEKLRRLAEEHGYKVSIASGGYEELQQAIAEREHAQEALRESRERLAFHERLATLGQLAGGVGHELRKPLATINNAAYLLSMALAEPEAEVAGALRMLEEEVGSCERIINSLLGFARPALPVLRKVTLRPLLQEVLARQAVPASIEVEVQADDALPEIMADPDQLGIAFGNIIQNAVQAMTSSSSVELREGGRLEVSAAPVSGERVAVSFQDTGPGILPEHMDKLFEPSFTTRSKGIGFGLAIAKILVDGHGGAIEVESEVGQGSTFTVCLPLAGLE